jgi:hypothetical protein
MSLRAAIGELVAIARASTPTHGRYRGRVLAILVATLGVDVVCAVIALLAERHGPQSQVHSFGTAIFWTSTQLLTVSSSMQNPVTTAGRVLDVFMELWAITVIAWLAGATGAFLHKRGEELEKLAPHAGR